MHHNLHLPLMLFSVAYAHLIPRQVIFTGKPRRLHDMPKEVQFNVQQTAGRHATASNVWHPTAGLQPRWFGDEACHAYIKKYYDEELLGFFETVDRGAYRGDICRAAVLYREGGFYTDVDVQMAVPLEDIVDEHTTFASVHSINGDIFNGLLAVVPNSEIMGETLQQMRRWYHNETERVGLMGTKTLQRALEHVMNASCPSVAWSYKQQKELQLNCGQHTIRLYREGDLLCFMPARLPQPKECPIERKKGNVALRYGFFIPGQVADLHRTIIGWPRFVACQDPSTGCGSGGHASFLEESVVQIEPSGTVNKRPSLVRAHLCC
jgi:hypothetical protein